MWDLGMSNIKCPGNRNTTLGGKLDSRGIILGKTQLYGGGAVTRTVSPERHYASSKEQMNASSF